MMEWNDLGQQYLLLFDKLRYVMYNDWDKEYVSKIIDKYSTPDDLAHKPTLMACLHLICEAHRLKEKK